MTETPEPIDAVLRSDHAAITRTLAELRSSVDPLAGAQLFERVCADIVRHDVAEEQYLLPAVRELLPDGEQISRTTFAEHEGIERLLRRLEDADTSRDAVGEILADLAAAVDQHVTQQEQHVLPTLVATADSRRLAELGTGVLGSEQLAPTHPRSFVPKSATLSKVTSWLTGLVEKSWDSREPR